MAGPDWGAPTYYSNEISASGSTTLSYKIIKLAYEYLASGAGEDSSKKNVDFAPPANIPMGVVGINWGKSFDSAPFFTPEPKEPPVPVMPERLT